MPVSIFFLLLLPLLFVAASAQHQSTSSNDCPKCVLAVCHSAKKLNCSGGHVSDACDCCSRCAKQKGEICDPDDYKDDSRSARICDWGLQCTNGMCRAVESPPPVPCSGTCPDGEICEALESSFNCAALTQCSSPAFYSGCSIVAERRGDVIVRTCKCWEQKACISPHLFRSHNECRAALPHGGMTECSDVTCRSQNSQCPYDSVYAPPRHGGHGWERPHCCCPQGECVCNFNKCTVPRCSKRGFRPRQILRGKGEPGSCCNVTICQQINDYKHRKCLKCLPKPTPGSDLCPPDSFYRHGGDDPDRNGRKCCKLPGECVCRDGCSPACGVGEYPVLLLRRARRYPGRCCDEYMCRRERKHCIDDKGVLRTAGSTWTDGPCMKCRCVTGVSVCEHENCQPCDKLAVTPKGECCPRCKDESFEGCIDGDNKYPVGSRWMKTSVCQPCRCLKNGGQPKCALECPQARPSCNAMKNCSYCSFEGEIRFLDERWEHKCVWHRCVMRTDGMPIVQNTNESVCPPHSCPSNEDLVNMDDKCCSQCRKHIATKVVKGKNCNVVREKECENCPVGKVPKKNQAGCCRCVHSDHCKGVMCRANSTCVTGYKTTCLNPANCTPIAICTEENVFTPTSIADSELTATTSLPATIARTEEPLSLRNYAVVLVIGKPVEKVLELLESRFKRDYNHFLWDGASIRIFNSKPYVSKDVDDPKDVDFMKASSWTTQGESEKTFMFIFVEEKTGQFAEADRVVESIKRKTVDKPSSFSLDYCETFVYYSENGIDLHLEEETPPTAYISSPTEPPVPEKQVAGYSTGVLGYAIPLAIIGFITLPVAIIFIWSCLKPWLLARKRKMKKHNKIKREIRKVRIKEVKDVNSQQGNGNWAHSAEVPSLVPSFYGGVSRHGSPPQDSCSKLSYQEDEPCDFGSIESEINDFDDDDDNDDNGSLEESRQSYSSVAYHQPVHIGTSV
eukprot:m.68959 g.68959  ORF g.68959 m.68959 type:complete len:961 (+) comp35575_c0_seq3:71-2953(+)